MGITMQHDERRCSVDVAVAVARPWAAAQIQWELGHYVTQCPRKKNNGEASKTKAALARA